MRIHQDDSPSTSREYSVRSSKSSSDRLFGYSRVVAPWATKRYNLSIEGLHEEVLDVFHWLRPSPLEASVRLRVFEKVAAAIRERWKEYPVRVSVFGSLRTHLFLPTSDIDVLVECDEWKTSPLAETAKYLEQTGMAKSISVFGDAFVPIVKMIEKDTDVNIDVSFNTVQGVKAADYIEKVKREFPVVEPLVLLLKQFLIERRLNTTYTGGLSSYGLILMLINFLQIYGLPVRGKTAYEDGVNLGELLMRFFEVYSQEFNYMDVGISVAHMCYRPKEKQNEKRAKSSVLSIEDPLLPTNEVGRSTFNFVAVKVAFEQALQTLKGVFVRDRRGSAAWSQRYDGSMLALIMPFSSKELYYRNWLKGFSLSYADQDPLCINGHIISNTFLSPAVDLSKCAWHYNIFMAPRHTRPLQIVSPNGSRVDNGDIAHQETGGTFGDSDSSSENAMVVNLRSTVISSSNIDKTTRTSGEEATTNSEATLPAIKNTLPASSLEERTPSPSENKTPPSTVLQHDNVNGCRIQTSRASSDSDVKYVKQSIRAFAVTVNGNRNSRQPPIKLSTVKTSRHVSRRNGQSKGSEEAFMSGDGIGYCVKSQSNKVTSDAHRLNSDEGDSSERDSVSSSGEFLKVKNSRRARFNRK